MSSLPGSQECLLGSDRPTVNHDRNSLSHKVLRALSNITIEPLLFIYILANCTSALTTNLLLDRVCILTFHGNETVCGNLSQYSELQSSVEKTTAQINLYCSLVSNLPSILLGPLMGAYSDVHGRKLPLIIPLVGAVASSLAQMVYAYLPSADPMWLVVCTVPRGIFGGFAVVIMACYAHVSDESRHRSRTSRIALVDAAMMLALPLGLILNNVLFANLGYWPVYGITAGLYLLALLYAVVRIDGNPPPNPSVADSNVPQYEAVSAEDDRHAALHEREQEEATPQIVTPKFCGWGCVDALGETLKTCCRERPRYGRAKLWTLIFALCCLVSTFNTSDFMYLYLKKRFDFSYFNYIDYTIVGLMIDLVGSFLILYGLSYRLGVSDLWLGLVSSLVLTTTATLTGLATSLAILFTAAGLSFCALVPLVVIRSQLSKSVGALEVGKVFSFVSAAESILPIVTQPVFTALFKATLDTVPGAVFFVNAGGCALSALSHGFLLLLQRWSSSELDELSSSF